MTTGSSAPRGIVGKIMKKLAPTKLGVWFILNVFHRLDPPLLRMTKGKFCLTALTGIPIGLLTTTGAKSGLERTTPLVFCPDGENVILIASYGGGERNPGWYYNLKANPAAHLLYRDYTGSYIAREVEGEERDLLWEKALAYYGGFGNYQERATNRQIPVMLLERQHIE
jgi:deazaflavin-dependent oxidoreductase (nitroreductase family)